MDSESDTDSSVNCWPRFEMMESTDNRRPLSRLLSPFALQNDIQGLGGVAKMVLDYALDKV